ncbi:TetR family transcriptional regulator [Streptomyces sp. SID8375]|nr:MULTISPECIES: TetR/AcrR family transcriptional regulator [unclassified Streptomyces]MYX06002.1 TetR family transcriptional regulator [Streptomyces sp. SID8375]GFE19932.1 TetR family transcriptional regulator [Streptomyces libani subsp. libani]GGV85279.1 TetR family transcriptional regulator [Streptomyces libani subsp. libani]
MAAEARSPRARYREQNRAEIKAAALQQLAEGGVQAVALTRIAKDMGLSGPALYRYFAGRDDLLSELIRDAYDEVAQVVGRVGAAPADDARATLHALADAYRGWAVAQPHRYLLIQGTPLPGYAAPPDTLLRARAVLGPFLKVFAVGVPAEALRPVVGEMAAWVRKEEGVADWLAQHTGLAPHDEAAGTALAGTVLVWSQLHGTVSLEVSGQYAGMGHRAQTLLAAQLDTLADSFQL